MWSHVHLEYVGEAVGRLDAHPLSSRIIPTEQVVDANASIASAALVNGLAGIPNFSLYQRCTRASFRTSMVAATSSKSCAAARMTRSSASHERSDPS